MGAKFPENQPKVTANGGGALTASVNTGAGAYNLNIDISAILTAAGYTLPSDATGVAIKTTLNKSFGTGQWVKIRSSGKTLPHVDLNMPATSRTDFIPFNGSSKLLDFYTSDITNYDFRIVAFTDSTWTYFDIDATLPQIASSGGSFQTKTITQVPENASVIASGKTNFNLEKWRPVGTATTSTTHTGTQMFYVDGSKQVQFSTNIPTDLVAYTTSGVNWNPWRTIQEVYTPGTSWTTATQTVAAGQKGLFLEFDKSGLTQWIDFKSTGSTYPIIANITQNGYDEGFFTAVNSSGQWDYSIESPLTGSLWLAATFDDYLNASISTIDNLIEGATSRVTFSSNFTPTGLTINDGVRTVTVTSFTAVGGNPAAWDFTCPALVAGSLGIKLGAVTVTATDGIITTNTFNDIYEKSGYTSIIAVSISPDAIGVGWSPAAQAGDQIAYINTHLTIDDMFILTATDAVPSSQTAWHYSTVDFKWRSFLLETNQVSSSTTGITTAGLTDIGLTNAGLTSAGL